MSNVEREAWEAWEDNVTPDTYSLFIIHCSLFIVHCYHGFKLE